MLFMNVQRNVVHMQHMSSLLPIHNQKSWKTNVYGLSKDHEARL